MNQSLKTCHRPPAVRLRFYGWLSAGKSAVTAALFAAATGGVAAGAEPSTPHPLRSATSATTPKYLSQQDRNSFPRRSLTARESAPTFTLNPPKDLFTAECDDAAGPAVTQALATRQPSFEPDLRGAESGREFVIQVAAEFPTDEQLEEGPVEIPAEPMPLETASPTELEELRETPPAPATQLRPISAINPYHDYDPDGSTCEHQCPPDVNCPEDPSLACPEEAPFYSATPPGRAFGQIQYCWTASNLYHRPLYFEDVGLERYGHVKRNEVVQQAWSLGKFGAQLIGLPYQMALDNPHACRYTLGYYQPGDCAPPMTYQIPLNAEAAITAGAVYTGAAFIIP